MRFRDVSVAPISTTLYKETSAAEVLEKRYRNRFLNREDWMSGQLHSLFGCILKFPSNFFETNKPKTYG